MTRRGGKGRGDAYLPTSAEIAREKRRLNAVKVDGHGHAVPEVMQNIGALVNRLREEKSKLSDKDKTIHVRLSPMVHCRFERLAHHCRMEPGELLLRLVAHAIEQVDTL